MSSRASKIIIILLILIILILIAPSCLLGIVYTSNANTVRSYSMPTQRIVLTAEDLSARIEGICKQQWGDEYTAELDKDSGFFTITTWGDGITADMVEDASKAEDKSAWESMVHSITQAVNNMQSIYSENGIDDVTVVLRIVDPDDHDAVYIAVANGIVGIDAVKGINLNK